MHLYSSILSIQNITNKYDYSDIIYFKNIIEKEHI